MKRYLLGTFAALLLASFGAVAQTAPVVTLTANPASCTASGCAPALTWSTTPAAASCTASGGWTGTKAASGTQTLPSITTPKTYTLTCVGQVSGTATLNWAPPTTNTNGTPLTNLAGYTIVWGASASTMAATVAVNDPTATTAQVTGIPSGTWFFAMVAVNSAGVQSDQSNVVSKTIPPGATGTASVTVDVAGKPNPPGSVTVAVSIALNTNVMPGYTVGYLLTAAGKRSDTVGGFVKLTAPCVGPVIDTYRGQGYQEVLLRHPTKNTTNVIYWKTAPDTRVVAPCA